MSPFDIIEVEKNGKLWRLHWRDKYDPITLSLAATAVGTGLQVAGTLKQGKQAQEIAEQRAAIDVQNAEAVRRASVEEAKIKSERGRKLIETQKSQAAAGGIRLNVGVPLVIEAETNAILAQDISFGLERGRVEEDAFLSSAALEIAGGKAAKKRSKFAALTQGLTGGAGVISGASDAGLFSKTPTPFDNPFPQKTSPFLLRHFS